MVKDTFFCPGNVPSSKNSRVWTGKYFVVSKAVTNWRKATKEWWEDNKDDFIEAIKEKEKPMKIGFHFIREQKRLYDFVNPLQTVQDEMVKHDWLKDDNVEEMFPFPIKIKGKYTTHNKEEPGVIIKIM